MDPLARTPTGIEFRILGPLEVLDNGRTVPLGGVKQRALLGLLLLHPNETLSSDRLIDELWGERPPASAAKAVQARVSRLRKALAPGTSSYPADVVVTRERGYELRLDPERLDAHRFERLVAEGRSELSAGRPHPAAAALERALSLWRGAALADLAYEPFAQPEIARLEDLRAGALEQLMEAKLALGRHAELVGELETLIAEHPYRERLRAQLMLALYRCDRQADALQAYQDTRRRLVEELGIEPGERLRELERAILAQDPGLQFTEAAEPAAAESEVETRRSASLVEFGILGPLEAWTAGRRVELGGPRQRSVLSVLLLHAGEVVPASALIDEVWREEPPETAANMLQGYVSELRKALGRDVIATRGRGYAIDVDPSALDLHRFEQLVSEADGAAPAVAADRLRRGLALWRGPALADLVDEPFAHAASSRLEELRLAALERRIEADLALGRHVELVGELEQLAREHPLRERPRAMLMLALDRCGRQAEALEAYQAARRTLIEELGIEPARALRELEQAILRQDPELEAPDAGAREAPAEPARHERSILVAPADDPGILRLVSIAEPLARRPPRELIVLRLLEAGEEPAPTTARLADLRDELIGRGLQMRVAAYTSTARGEDAVLLATEQDVDLLLVDAPAGLLDTGRPGRDLDTILRRAPCDVAVLLTGGSLYDEPPRPVVVPFGGVEHDWSAVELAAWVARARETTLRLVGTSADRLRRRRDASRLLGRASLVVQAVAGIVVEPALVRRGAEGVLEAASDASLLVVGMSGRWQREGLGAARLALAQEAGVPVLLDRRGLRPGGLAPKESMTRFTWSLAS